MSRFAGSSLGVDVANFMPKSISYDNLGNRSLADNYMEKANSYDAQSQVAQAGFKAEAALANAELAATKIETDAEVAAAQSRGQAISSLGDSLGKGISGLAGSSAPSGFGSNPSSQVAFGTGGGTFGGFGTLGPNWGIKQ